MKIIEDLFRGAEEDLLRMVHEPRCGHLTVLAQRVDRVAALLDAVEALDAAEADETCSTEQAMAIHEDIYQATRTVVDAANASRWTSDPADAEWYAPLAALADDFRARANKLGSEVFCCAAAKPCEACAAAPVEFDEEDES